MKRVIVAASWLLIGAMACAQTPRLSKRDKLAIERAKNVLVSAFDQRLPKVTLEYFLKSESHDGRIEWEVNDCGEQTGSPATDRGRDFPICAQATVSGRELRTVTVMVGVGTHKKGVTGTPELAGVTVSDENGDRSVHLFDVPAEMHRGRLKPRQSPRDPPDRSTGNQVQ
ncbi:MAG: hypothetical protein LAN64_01735 [Acidobacteriia bacterium]|nr:hypothetical protein [Terriglobia bacterium]